MKLASCHTNVKFIFVLFYVPFLLLCCLVPITAQVYRQQPPSGNPIAVNINIISYQYRIISMSYHINIISYISISYHINISYQCHIIYINIISYQYIISMSYHINIISCHINIISIAYQYHMSYQYHIMSY